jgi:hypothetical protein
MKIFQSKLYDLAEIYILYGLAIEYQKINLKKEQFAFDEFLIKKEISENRQWKIMEGDHMACIFAISFNSPYIWGEKDNDPALYLHRIVTSPFFKGGDYVNKIVIWARKKALEQNLLYIRMDTMGNDKSLIAYYQSCGFKFIGTVTPGNAEDLRRPHRNILLSLFEINIDEPDPGKTLRN